MKTRQTPWVTLILVLASLVASFVVVAAPELINEYGFKAHAPSLVTGLTAIFLHANVFHLLANALTLAAVGSWVEEALGPIRYTFIFLLGGILGAVVHWVALRNVAEAAPLIGMSGAVAACTAYGAIRYMWSRVPLGPRIQVPVVAVAGLWASLQVLGAFVTIGEDRGVSFWAHLGGLAAGLLAAAIFAAPRHASAQQGRKVVDAAGDQSPAAVVNAARDYLRHHPQDVPTWNKLVEAQSMLGDEEGERESLAKLVDLVGREEKPPLYRRLWDLGHFSPASPRKRTEVASEIADADATLAREILLGVVLESSGPARADAMLQLATFLRETQPKESAEWAARLAEEHPMDDAVTVARGRGLLP